VISLSKETWKLAFLDISPEGSIVKMPPLYDIVVSGRFYVVNDPKPTYPIVRTGRS
jgi:hypothetical protein